MANNNQKVNLCGDLSKTSVYCLVFLELKINLIIKDEFQSQILSKCGKDLFAFNSSSLRVTQLEHNQQMDCISSGQWIILLGSCGEEYQLFINSDRNSHTLNAGKGQLIIIEAKSGRHLSFNNRSAEPSIDGLICGQLSDQLIEDSHEWQMMSIKNEIKDKNKDTENERLTVFINDLSLVKERIIDLNINKLLPNLSFDPNEVLDRLRQFSKEYFSEKDKTKKTALSHKLNEYLPKIIAEICETLNAEILEDEPRIVLVRSPSFAFGDLHGNLQDLYDYEKLFWKSGKRALQESNYLFLGDFVDRGPHGVEVSVYLFLLKLTDSKKFILVRGNHEVRVVNKAFTFYKECTKKYGNLVGAKVWDQINSCFDRLPIAAIVDERVFCCHGGVPKSITKLEDVMAIPKPLVNPEVESPGAHEILWNDPVESMTTFNSITSEQFRERNIHFIRNRARSTGFYYTELAVDHFFETNHLLFMIRAHESVREGFRIHFDGRVVTVFSSSHYCGMNNSTACIKIISDQIQPVIVKAAQRSVNR